jgi:uncharacterized protein (DUF1800 family)
MLDQNYIDTAHLLRRAGFGAAPDEIQAAAQRGLAQTTDDLLHYERIPNPIKDDDIIVRLTNLIPEERRTLKNGEEYMPLQVVKMWWTQRMLATPHPLVEKMTLFWHGHFTSKLGGRMGDDMLRQNQMFRQNALGNFRTLTLAVSRDPAMLRYLNGNENYKAHPNENYGRELMELYTCGIGNYTEDDVKAASRAFSGWNLRAGQFFFNANQHDNTPKTFLGKTGNWNGDDIVDMLVAHPATARRTCTKIFEYLAYPNPEPAVIDALVKTYYGSGYDIREIVSQILHSHAFYSDKARYAVIKCPVQYAIGAVKVLGLSSAFEVQPDDITPANAMATPAGGTQPGTTVLQRVQAQKLGGLAFLPNAMRSMGQDLLEPPSVKGWDGGERWINTSTLLARVNFANYMSQSRQAFGGQFAQAVSFVRQNNFNGASYVDYLAETLGPLPLTPQTRQTLIDFVNGVGDPTATAEDQNAAAAGPYAYARGRRRNALLAANGGAAVPGNLAGALRKGNGKRGGAGGLTPIAGPGGLEGRLRAVIPMIMSTPEFQVC